MALQLGALNEALRKAGVDDAPAGQAAGEAAAYQDRLGAIERQMDQRFSAVDQWFSRVDRELAVLGAELRFQRWVNMTTLGLVLAVLIKLFVH